jgi:hypothetical protein
MLFGERARLRLIGDFLVRTRLEPGEQTEPRSQMRHSKLHLDHLAEED